MMSMMASIADMHDDDDDAAGMPVAGVDGGSFSFEMSWGPQDAHTCIARHTHQHESRITHHASHITHQTSHITHHTSHITHHTSHIIHHASRITHHT
jgi:hypothetical protein